MKSKPDPAGTSNMTEIIYDSMDHRVTTETQIHALDQTGAGAPLSEGEFAAAA
jgi:hypothetical protein